METNPTKKQNVIKQAIKELGTQKEFAQKMGVELQTVKMWMLRGEVSNKFLFKFCDLTGLKPSDVNQFAKSLRDYRTKTPSMDKEGDR